MPRHQSPKSKNRAATLADVGREAGVSVMAVSAVINGARTSSRISDDTRARILKAANKLKYRPNAAARALADRRMNTIGVVTRVDGGELNHYFLNLFNGILEAAAVRKQNTTVFAIEEWHNDSQILQSICDGRIDGAIILAPQFSSEDNIFVPSHTPFVTVHANIDLEGAINLETHELKGAENATQHLIDRGHRRILHLSGPPKFIGARRRIDGYQNALKSSGIEFDPTLVVEANFSTENAHLVMREWIQSNQGKEFPHAIFAANDTMAIGAMQALAEHGMKAPDDYSIIGFDDTIVCRSSVPQLSSVAQPLRKMGRIATETLLKVIDSPLDRAEDQADRNIVFDTELIERASVGPPRSKPWIM